ncbi:MAG TPA: hypothetical protein VI932_03150 [Bacteroidota bacterium]|nr:hypothetical protein [Bacteroidota bacterium]
MAIIIVIGLSLTVGIVGYSLNNSKTGTIENVAGFDKYTMTRNMAHTAVNMALRALDRNDSLFVATRHLQTNIMGGASTVSMSYPFFPALDTVDLTATSTFMDTTRLMRLRLHRKPVPFPIIQEAVGLRVPNVNFSMNGNPQIDGRDHTMAGLLLPPSAKDKPGVGFLTAADTADAAPYASKIDGTPQDAVYDTTIADPGAYVDEYISAADRLFATGVYGSNMIWGSPVTPWIVFCDGDVKFTGNIDGWGILLVRGSLTLAGTFKFRGLVIAYQETTIDVQFATGTPDVVGGLIMSAASGGKFEMKGNSAAVYSSEALEMAKYINKLQVYRVVRWYE